MDKNTIFLYNNFLFVKMGKKENGKMIYLKGGFKNYLPKWILVFLNVCLLSLTVQADTQDPCVITNISQLQNMKNNLSGYYVLGCDVNASATVSWNGGAGFEPIGTGTDPFTGFFDARGYIIDNLYIKRPTTDYVGLFGKTSSATIKNLGLTDVNIAGMNYVGALAGWCDSGTITKCYVSGKVSGSNDLSPPSYTPTANGIWAVTPYTYYSSPYYYVSMTAVTANDISPPVLYYFDESGGAKSGWITSPTWTAGPYFDGTRTYQVRIKDSAGNEIKSSWWTTWWDQYQNKSKGEVCTNCGCYPTLCVSTTTKICSGGLFGCNKGNLSQCYSIAAVNGYDNVGGLIGKLDGGSVTNCYSAGGVSGTSNVGGLIGYNNSGSVVNSFWDVNTSGRTTSAGGTGKTTNQMQDINTFLNAGWDFTGETANGTDDIWRMCANGVYYPRLELEYSKIGDFTCPGGVDFEDLAYFLSYWLSANCGENNNCNETDLNVNGTVNFVDFAAFAENWLEGN